MVLISGFGTISLDDHRRYVIEPAGEAVSEERLDRAASWVRGLAAASAAPRWLGGFV
jgi:hypothetical protein